MRDIRRELLAPERKDDAGRTIKRKNDGQCQVREVWDTKRKILSRHNFESFG
jgi:hypothetical protein